MLTTFKPLSHAQSPLFSLSRFLSPPSNLFQAKEQYQDELLELQEKEVSGDRIIASTSRRRLQYGFSEHVLHIYFAHIQHVTREQSCACYDKDARSVYRRVGPFLTSELSSGRRWKRSSWGASGHPTARQRR